MSLTREIEPGHHHEPGGNSRAGQRPDTVPRRLFRDGNAGFWNPDDIDLTQDEADFAMLPADERRLIRVLIANLLAASESVHQDLQPFVTAVAAEGRRDDEAYLTQLLFEEAKHAQAIRTWFEAVGIGDDLPWFAESGAFRRRIFLEELSWSLYALTDDHSPAAQIRASVTHNHIVEGSLALTCYAAWGKICQSHGIFPGLGKIIQHIATDERRHVAWGTFTCRRHVAADDDNWTIVTLRTQELLPLATALITDMLTPVESGTPFGINTEALTTRVLARATRRLRSIAQARGRRVEEIDRDHSPMRVEDENVTARPGGDTVSQTVAPIKPQRWPPPPTTSSNSRYEPPAWETGLTGAPTGSE
ncbi:R2-like ligand-binding oxidase [Amycolatopsis sp. NPDC057786]|uniref:R2-like ligand-binding oxidase n=1 Tax=Amycolatopsis sp. NPDC057786 TaxID=3346250 RepID=UPI00366FDD27